MKQSLTPAHKDNRNMTKGNGRSTVFDKTAILIVLKKNTTRIFLKKHINEKAIESTSGNCVKNEFFHELDWNY